jgi:phosphatidylinositol alpha-1,6-mannosyltransferase
VNILLLTSEFSPINGGIGTYAREMAAAATRLGARVTVIAPDYSEDLMENDRSFPFRVLRFRGGLHSMRDLPSKIFLARESVRMGNYDVVHAADWPFFIPLALSRKRTHGRLLMTVHGTEINEMQAPLKRLAIRTARVFGPKVEVAANSGFTRDLFSAHFPVASQQVQAIRLGVSDFWFGSSNNRAATRAAHDLAPDKIVMVTVARLTRRKGHHLTLAALSALPEQLRKRISWLVVGPDGEADYVVELHRLIAASGCDVRLLGALPNEQIRDIYGASDFFCLTGVPDSSGRVEGFGLVYLEAGAGGLPSVATAIGGVPDAVLKDESGLLVQPSATAITRAIAELAEDAGKRAILAAGATAHARMLSWERCAAETYRLPRPEDAKRDDPSLADIPSRPTEPVPYMELAGR